MRPDCALEALVVVRETVGYRCELKMAVRSTERKESIQREGRFLLRIRLFAHRGVPHKIHKRPVPSHDRWQWGIRKREAVRLIAEKHRQQRICQADLAVAIV